MQGDSTADYTNTQSDHMDNPRWPPPHEHMCSKQAAVHFKIQVSRQVAGENNLLCGFQATLHF